MKDSQHIQLFTSRALSLQADQYQVQGHDKQLFFLPAKRISLWCAQDSDQHIITTQQIICNFSMLWYFSTSSFSPSLACLQSPLMKKKTRFLLSVYTFRVPRTHAALLLARKCELRTAASSQLRISISSLSRAMCYIYITFYWTWCNNLLLMTEIFIGI